MAYLQPARNVFTVKRVLAILLIVALQCPHNVRASTNLGSKCQHDMDCTDFIKGSACSAHGYCECAPYFVQYNATSCLSSQLLGGDCILDDQCTMKVANSSCSDGACRCVEGFLQFRKHTCLGPAHPGAVCYSHAHCGMFDKRTHCDFLIPNLFGRCQCTAPTKMIGGLCVDTAGTDATTTSTTTTKLEVPTVTSTTTPSTTSSTSTSTTAPSTTTTTTTTTITTTEAPQLVIEESVPIAESVEEEQQAKKEAVVVLESPAQFDDTQPLAVVAEMNDVAHKIDIAEMANVVETANGDETANGVETSNVAETVDITGITNLAEAVNTAEISEIADTFDTAETTSQQSLHTPADVPVESSPANEDETATVAQESVATDDYPYKIDEEYAEEHANVHEEDQHAYEPALTTISTPAATAADVIVDEHHEQEEANYEGDDVEDNHDEKVVPVDDTMKFDYETAAQEELVENVDHIIDDANEPAAEQEAPEAAEDVETAATAEENVLVDEMPQAVVPISADAVVEINAEETTVGYHEEEHEIAVSNNNEGDNNNTDEKEVGDMQDKIESDTSVQQVEEVAPVAAAADAETTDDQVLEQENAYNEVNASSEEDDQQHHHHELIEEHENNILENKITADQQQGVDEQSTDKQTSVENDLFEANKPVKEDNDLEPEPQSEAELTAQNEDIHVAEASEEDIATTEATPVAEFTFQINNDELEQIPEEQQNEVATSNQEEYMITQHFEQDAEPINDAEAVETAQVPEIVLSPTFESEHGANFEESKVDAEVQETTQVSIDELDKVEDEDTSNLNGSLTETPVEFENLNNEADKRIAEFNTDQPEIEKEENNQKLSSQIENGNETEDSMKVNISEDNINNFEVAQKDKETEVGPNVDATTHDEFENIIEGAEPIFEIFPAPVDEQQEVHISESVNSVEDAPIKNDTNMDNTVVEEEIKNDTNMEITAVEEEIKNDTNMDNTVVKGEINILENSLEIEANPSNIEEQTATTRLPELDYSNVESFEDIENEQPAPLETENIAIEKPDNKIEVSNELNSNANVDDNNPLLVEQTEVVPEAEQEIEDFKESESIADILSDLMAEEDVTTTRTETLEAPKEDIKEIELNHEEIINEVENVPHHEAIDEIPDLIAEDTNISEEKFVVQEDPKIKKEGTTESMAESENANKLITFYPAMTHEHEQTIEQVTNAAADNKEQTSEESNADKLITFYPEMAHENEQNNEEVSDTAVVNKEQTTGEQNISEDLPDIEVSTESSHFEEPQRTLSPEELPFDMSMEDAVQPQELESDNLIVETTTSSETDAAFAAVAEAAQQGDHEAATANPSDIVEITTQTMLGLASRVTLMEPAAPVATTLKPLMSTTDDVTPEPNKELLGADAILTIKPTTEIRKRVEQALEAVSLGLTCFNDKQCQLADSNTICNTRGICDCAAASAYPAQTQCSAERTGCSPGTFQCRSSGVCISWFFVCDGRADCNDGSDEECSFNARLNQTCPTEAFHCTHSGHCISRAAICDGRRQCPHGEDEIGCGGVLKAVGGATTTCPPHTFRCNSGECLPEYEYCNAIISCKDGSDEPPHLCGSRSMPNFFLRLLNAGGLMGSSDPNAYCPHRCSNGRCRSTAIVCSGRDGCGDGTDEQTCSVCRCPSPARETIPAFLARHRPMPLW